MGKNYLFKLWNVARLNTERKLLLLSDMKDLVEDQECLVFNLRNDSDDRNAEAFVCVDGSRTRTRCGVANRWSFLRWIPWIPYRYSSTLCCI